MTIMAPTMINTSQLARIAVIAMLVLGCFLVLRPFLAAILFAAIVCVSTWPFYRRVRTLLHERNTLAALVMTLLMLLALFGPLTYLAINLADGVTTLLDHVQRIMEAPPASAPDWIANLPLVGEYVERFWQQQVASRENFMQLLGQYYEPLRRLGLKSVQLVGEGVLQLAVVVFVAFFMYRGGASLRQAVETAAHKLGGELGSYLLALSGNTVKAVMMGIVGTAAVQAAVAFIGFILVGAPTPILLASATFFLSMIPVGPPMVWGGVAIWLFEHGQTGWAVFMLLYGFFAISSVDNVVKPMLISQAAHLPFWLIVLGVFGGILAFGFVGIFVGPVLLALGLALARHWIEMNAEEESEVVT